MENKDKNQDENQDEITDTTGDIDQEEVTKKKIFDRFDRGSVKKIILIFVIVAVVCVLLTCLFFWLKKRNDAPVVPQYSYLELGPMLIEMGFNTGKKYLKIDLVVMSLEHDKENDFKMKENLIKDAIVMFFMSLGEYDLHSTGNLIYLKSELLKRINKVSSPLVVNEILFKEIITN